MIERGMSTTDAPPMMAPPPPADEAPSGRIPAAPQGPAARKPPLSEDEDAALPGRSARSYRRLRAQLQLRRQDDGTLPLFPLVPGDVRGRRVLRQRQQSPADDDAVGGDGDDQSGACLGLFPLTPGDLSPTKGSDSSACEAAAMDAADAVSDGDLLEMRLSPASTAMAEFRAMVQAVRAPAP